MFYEGVIVMPKGKDTVERKIYFDLEAWEKVCLRVELSGKKVSKFIKEMAIYGEVKIYDISPYLSLVYDLRSIGENLNQIIRLAKSTDSIYLKDLLELKAELKRLEDVFDKYFEELEHNPIE